MEKGTKLLYGTVVQLHKLLCSLVPDGKLDAKDVTYDLLGHLLKSNCTKKQSTIAQVHLITFEHSLDELGSIEVLLAGITDTSSNHHDRTCKSSV